MNKVNNVFKSFSEKIFIEDSISHQKISYKNFFIQAYTLSRYLKKIGIKNKSEVLVISENSFFKIIFFFSSLFNNYNLILLDNNQKKKIIKKFIDQSKAEHIFFDKINLKKFKKKNLKSEYFIVSKDFKKKLSLDHIVQNQEQKNFIKYIKSNSFSLTSPFITILTSGTTGEPKGIVHSIQTLINSAENFNKFNKIKSNCIFAHFFSMNYMAGILNSIISPFIAGGKIVLLKQFNSLSGLNFWELAIKYNINYFWASPTMLNLIINLNRYKYFKNYIKNKFKKAFIGTGYFPSQQKKNSKQIFNNKIFESYGTTEDLFISCDDKKSPNFSCGKVLPKVKIKLSKSKNILVKSNSKNIGIYDFKKKKIIKTNKIWRDTQDVGKKENDYIFILGRDKDLIIKGGKNIYPIIIENLIYTEKNIKQVAVVGLKNDLYGEEIVIFYNTHKKVNLKVFENKLKRICEKHLSTDYKPDKIIFTKKFQTTISGKIKKKLLIN